jgi:hypothetical protein
MSTAIIHHNSLRIMDIMTPHLLQGYIARAGAVIPFLAALPILVATFFLTCTVYAQDIGDWAIHDRDRPQPPVVEPGTASTPEQPGRPPSDAIVLFSGDNLDEWESVHGGPAPWELGDGFMAIDIGTGSIRTKREFGDVQLHIEWSAPVPPQGTNQSRGNSGVFLMGRYEVQVLDSYESQTYPDGQASAIYGQYPPLVNAARPPGEWQMYDIIFRRPRFKDDGELETPARMTVLHNGVLVHDCAVLTGPTGHYSRPPYAKHPDRLSLELQDHNDSAVRYRNIWVRDLEE